MDMDVKQAAHDFWVEFQTSKDGILAALQAALAAGGDSAAAVAQAKADLGVLSKRVTDATVFLPLYDQRQCAQHLKDAQDAVAKVQAPRAKFAFKSRKAAPPTPSVVAAQALPAVSVAGPSTATAAEHHASGSAPPDLRSLPPNAMAFTHLDSKHITSGAPSAATAAEHDVFISNVSNTIIDLRGTTTPIGAVHIQNVSNSVILFGPIRGSILVQQCTKSLIAVACRQCRVHESRDLVLHLFVPSHPIIEDCDGVRFAPYDPASGPRDWTARLQMAGLDPTRNQFDQVEDFNWLKQQASPHWRVMRPGESTAGAFPAVGESTDGRADAHVDLAVLSAVLQ
ncbi:tubulin binding cofactor C-domain-containing protein [Entophlyctis helioformis]|nr:tubulin binding cofactor C-domain-containing protein [Entophlyctis helioformis]